MSPGAQPRTGLRDTEPYTSPQPPAGIRLNTNECPHPLPNAFFDELALAVRDLPLHRYPDDDARRLREELAATVMYPVDGIWVANGSNEILTELLQAYGGPGRRASRSTLSFDSIPPRSPAGSALRAGTPHTAHQGASMHGFWWRSAR